MVDSHPFPSHEFAIQKLQETCESVCRDFGFTHVSPLAINKLAAIFRSKISEHAQDTRLFMESTGRTEPSLKDVLAAMNHKKVNLKDLEAYAKEVKPNRLAALPVFPVPDQDITKSDDTFYKAMYGPKPSDQELKTRQDHVPSHHRAIHPTWIEKDDKESILKDIKMSRITSIRKKKTSEAFPSFDDMSFSELGFLENGCSATPTPKPIPSFNKRNKNEIVICDNKTSIDTNFSSELNFSKENIEPSYKEIPLSFSNLTSSSSSKHRHLTNLSTPKNFNRESDSSMKLNSQKPPKAKNSKKTQEKSEKKTKKPSLTETIRDQMLRAKSQMILPTPPTTPPLVTPQLATEEEDDARTSPFNFSDPVFNLDTKASDSPGSDILSDFTEDKKNKSKKEKRDKNSEEYKEYKRQKKERRRKEREEREATESTEQMEKDQLTSSQNTSIADSTPNLKIKLKIRFSDLREPDMSSESPFNENSKPLSATISQSQLKIKLKQVVGDEKENEEKPLDKKKEAKIDSKQKEKRKSEQKKVISQNDSSSNRSEENDDTWICPACSLVYTEGENMVGCDKCEEWFHWHCVGLTAEPTASKWFCNRCTKESKSKKNGKRSASGPHQMALSAKRMKHFIL